MTPEERELVANLFNRLAALEREPRDPEAERVIREGLAKAPNAVYSLVQAVLMAEARLKDLADERRPAGEQRGLFGSWFGRGGGQPSSVPQVPRSDAPMGVPPGFRTREEQPSAPPPGYGGAPGFPPGAGAGAGGSFLGTAAAAVIGALGGTLLGRMLGGSPAEAASRPAGFGGGEPRMPWSEPGGSGADKSDLAREAGLGDIGRSAGPRDPRPAREEESDQAEWDDEEGDEEEWEYGDEDPGDIEET
jgi:hypothetical protein